MSFARRLKAARVAAELTQDAVAALLGVLRGQVARWESGRSEPTVTHLRDLCEALDVPADELLFGKDGETETSPIVLRLGPRANAHVDELVDLGLYGLDRSDVCERLVCAQLREILPPQKLKEKPQRKRRRAR